LDCKKIKKLALELALAAGKIQMRKFRSNLDIRWKGLTDPVTEVDQACEALILKGVNAKFPGHAFLGEESGVHGPKDAPFLWIIDPLDGTVNYSHGLPMFCVSIGIYERTERAWGVGIYAHYRPLIGVIHAPALGETFVAERGKGAFCNGKRLRVSKQAEPLRAVLCSGFAYQARESGENMREWMGVVRNFQALRRLGSAAMDLCWVAAGRFDGFWEYGLKPWDVAAAGLIVTEAGGKITNIQGQVYDMAKPGIVATNGKLHSPLLKVLKKALASKLRWPLF
jgi:myo-inositol-1(or 4)-monophosphatase